MIENNMSELADVKLKTLAGDGEAVFQKPLSSSIKTNTSIFISLCKHEAAVLYFYIK